jgi:acetyltransferase-like isoleucine patch superfamily enzyme
MIKKILFKLRLSMSNEYQKPNIYRKYLKVQIGEKARFTGSIHFGSEPFLISIGNHVTLAHNVTFHTHDGGVWIFRDKHPNINIYGKIKVGNNVFIGSNVIILPNVEIGDNVVIGAGSIVTKSISSNAVAAGNPAKVIRSVKDYEIKVLANAIMINSHNMETASKEIVKFLDNKTK